MNIDIRIIWYLQKNNSGYRENFFPNFPWLITLKTKTFLTFPEFPREAFNLIWFSNFPWFSRRTGTLTQFFHTKPYSPMVEITVGHQSWPTRFPIWQNSFFPKFIKMTNLWIRLSGLQSVTNCMCLI